VSKAPLKKALDETKIEKKYRSGLEEKIAAQLLQAGIEFDYEGYTVPYSVPARVAKYTPDFTCGGIIIEGKGNFGAGSFFRGRFSGMSGNSAKERQKFALLKEQHPRLDIRFVFSRASAPIYKNSPTTHAKWAEDHGFKWAEKSIPPAWLIEMQKQQKRK
jgi:hypothetical protein